MLCHRQPNLQTCKDTALHASGSSSFLMRTHWSSGTSEKYLWKKNQLNEQRIWPFDTLTLHTLLVVAAYGRASVFRVMLAAWLVLHHKYELCTQNAFTSRAGLCTCGIQIKWRVLLPHNPGPCLFSQGFNDQPGVEPQRLLPAQRRHHLL